MAKTWTEEDLDNALYHYFHSDDGIRPTAKKFGIPRSTLGHYVKKKRKQYERQSGAETPSKQRNRTYKLSSGASKPVSQASKSTSQSSKSVSKPSKISHRTARTSGETPSKDGSKTAENPHKQEEFGRLSVATHADPGQSLGQDHAYQALKLEGKKPWWFCCGVLACLSAQWLGKMVASWWSSRQSGQQEVSEKPEKPAHSTEDEEENLVEEKNPNLPSNSQYAGKGLNIG